MFLNIYTYKECWNISLAYTVRTLQCILGVCSWAYVPGLRNLAVLVPGDAAIPPLEFGAASWPCHRFVADEYPILFDACTVHSAQLRQVTHARMTQLDQAGNHVLSRGRDHVDPSMSPGHATE